MTGDCNLSAGNFSLSLPDALTGGTYQITYTQKISGGNANFPYRTSESEKSPKLELIIDDKAPHSLDLAVDTLTNNSIHQPILTFQAEDDES